MKIKAKLPVGLRRVFKIGRVLLFERLGSRKYSFPALNNLDRQILEILNGGVNPGVFLEVGANDGYSQSNTWYLERHCGWSGVLIEPLPSPFRWAQRLRSESLCFNVACTDDDTAGRILTLVDSNLTTRIGETGNSARLGPRRGRAGVLQVATSTISSVLDAASITHLDLMCVDVEGAELSLLAGLDLERHCPRILVVETDTPDLVSELLNSKMQLVKKLSFHDYLWIRIE